jgi:hypothetical protein
MLDDGDTAEAFKSGSVSPHNGSCVGHPLLKEGDLGEEYSRKDVVVSEVVARALPEFRCEYIEDAVCANPASAGGKLV